MTALPPPIDFDREIYDVLHAIVFRGDYPGYRPTVAERPDGVGGVDADKRYAHVALKYLPGWGSAAGRRVLLAALTLAHDRAELVAEALGVRPEHRPDIRYGALRVLEYPPGAMSHEHTDVSLFTLALYRDRPECFHRQAEWTDIPTAALALNRGLHLGRLGEELGLGKATRHSVSASTETQHSLVYFAIPDHDARLVPGERGGSPTVGEFVAAQMAGMRTAKEGA